MDIREELKKRILILDGGMGTCIQEKGLSYDGNNDGEADFTALFTGDAEKDELNEMISDGDVGRVDLLKVGHNLGNPQGLY